MNDNELDDLFATARALKVEPSTDFMARILQDAEANQPHSLGINVPSAARKKGLWATMLAAIGGGAAFAGLSTATIAGLWLGFVQPTPLTTVTDSFWASETLESVDLIPSFDNILTEG
jgi:hypothetical protein